MDGLLIIDKPAGITSHDVVARVRRILATRRVGHTGTLDPFATGVLILLVGKATRLAQFLDNDEKEYEATIQFGYETDTGDKTGTAKRDTDSTADLSGTDWQRVFSEFRGETMQTPPMYSAKKIEGKKLYELARRGIDVEREPVRIAIRELELQDGVTTVEDSMLGIRVVCSAGTYIRTLAEDIGRAVGVGAHLAELRRIRAGRFDIKAAVTLDELEKSDHATSLLTPLSEAVAHLPSVRLAPDRVTKTLNGLATRLPAADFQHGASIRMLSEDSDLIAIGTYDAAEKQVKPRIVLV